MKPAELIVKALNERQFKAATREYLIKETELKPATVSAVLTRLKERRFIIKEGEGKEKVWKLNPNRTYSMTK